MRMAQVLKNFVLQLLQEECQINKNVNFTIQQ
jgi:hypothetical protein